MSFVFLYSAVVASTSAEYFRLNPCASSLWYSASASNHSSSCSTAQSEGSNPNPVGVTFSAASTNPCPQHVLLIALPLVICLQCLEDIFVPL